ncbi:DUF4190 domain-containing protein [Leucobacter soli]|uniref:DUF4190 domain-containing protein n=1 Tax=Leucobacter soli TaxID=2812850 RepID=A0A916NFN6_9MICO|nr:DUF4190 domain-containing protein [Leucobacter soli]CAG7599624.1 hypothetical protein LEUCIP111803_00311 [Leucobacter soli]
MTAPYPNAPQPVRPQATTVGQTNAFALVSVILAFIQPIAAIVFGHLAINQIKRNGDGGRGIALTGLIIGYVYVASFVLFILIYVSIIALAIGSMGSLFSELDRMSYYS